MALKLEVGKRYVNRIGQIVGPMAGNTFGPFRESHPFRADGCTYMENGLVLYMDAQTEMDLVGEWIPSAVEKPKRKVLSLNRAARQANEAARKKGFWDEYQTEAKTDKHRNAIISQKIQLISDELSEAHEELRQKGTDPTWFEYYVNKSGKPEGIAPELADVLIRTLDLMHQLGIDAEAVVRRKLKFNKTRPTMHGKRF